MLAMFKKELRSYFRGVTGFVFVALLRTDLNDRARFFGDFRNQFGFFHRQGKRFLDVNRFSGAHRLDGYFDVPMVWRADRYDVDRRIVDDSFVILKRLALIREIRRESFREGKIDVGAGDDRAKFARASSNERSASVERLVVVPNARAIFAYADRADLQFFDRALFPDGLFAGIQVGRKRRSDASGGGSETGVAQKLTSGLSFYHVNLPVNEFLQAD